MATRAAFASSSSSRPSTTAARRDARASAVAVRVRARDGEIGSGRDATSSSSSRRLCHLHRRPASTLRGALQRVRALHRGTLVWTLPPEMTRSTPTPTLVCGVRARRARRARGRGRGRGRGGPRRDVVVVVVVEPLLVRPAARRGADDVAELEPARHGRADTHAEATAGGVDEETRPGRRRGDASRRRRRRPRSKLSRPKRRSVELVVGRRGRRQQHGSAGHAREDALERRARHRVVDANDGGETRRVRSRRARRVSPRRRRRDGRERRRIDDARVGGEGAFCSFAGRSFSFRFSPPRTPRFQSIQSSPPAIPFNAFHF